MALDRDVCYSAVLARDSRFDGSFFTAVKTTKIYCRPICPARTPHAKNCDYFASAASAQIAGYRPCLRCRPELSPTVAAWRGTENTVSRALALIAQGALDDDHTVDQLAERLGMGERQLRRLFSEHLGASPMAVAQTRRVLFAKQLLHDSSLSITQVALASGYRSVRRFNEAFRNGSGKSPTELRRLNGHRPKKTTDSNTTTRLKMSYRGAYDWRAAMAELLRLNPTATAAGRQYRQTFVHQGAPAELLLSEMPGYIELLLKTESVTSLHKLVARVREALDLDADLPKIHGQLAMDSMLARRVKTYPGLRLVSAIRCSDFDEQLNLNAREELARGSLSDAFDSTDQALQRVTKLGPNDLEARAEQWRPWRAYAVQQLRHKQAICE